MKSVSGSGWKPLTSAAEAASIPGTRVQPHAPGVFDLQGLPA
jgi:hypothetical protein